MSALRTARACAIVLAAASTLCFAVAGSEARPIDPARSSIASTAQLASGAQAVRLEGVLHCATCRRFTLGATVSQNSSGAVGQGGVRCVCHASAERWVVTAHAREATRFQPGAARVCIWVIARRGTGKPIDAAQWCEPVMLKAVEA